MSAGRHSDVVIIGGGVMGLFTALNLASCGRDVVVLERNRIWGEASGVNAGSLGVQNKLLPLVPYAAKAVGVWRNVFERWGLDADFHQTGGYKVATTREEVERLREGSSAQAQRGIPIRWLNRSDLSKEAPWLADEVLAATFCPLDSFASPIRVGGDMHRALKHAGVEVIEGAAVRSVQRGREWRIETQIGIHRSRDVVIAAGAWSGRVAEQFGAQLPVALDVNMVTVTEPAPRMVEGIVSHTRGILTVKQVSNGSCLIGGGWQGAGTLDDMRKEIELDQLVHNLTLASRIIPTLKTLHVLRSWAGYEGVSPDSLPYIGHLPGVDNVYVAACARGGFTLGPLFAQLLSEAMTTGQPSMSIEPFNPARFCYA
jgi:sarcosine oxidase, subunit beta